MTVCIVWVFITQITPISQTIHALPVMKLSPHPPPGRLKGQAPSAHFRRVQPIVVHTRGRWSFGPFLHMATCVKECLDTPRMVSREKVTICRSKVSCLKSMVLAMLLTVSRTRHTAPPHCVKTWVMHNTCGSSDLNGAPDIQDKDS